MGMWQKVIQEPATLAISLKSLLVSLLFVPLFFASAPFSFLFRFPSLVTQFIHPHNVHLPMAIMALQASYYVMNRHFPPLSGNVSQYSLGHIPKKEKWMALFIAAHLPNLWSITLQNFDWLSSWMVIYREDMENSGTYFRACKQNNYL